MTPQLIPVCETYEALVAGIRKTAVMRACMILKTCPTFEKLSRSDRIRLGRLPCMNTSLVSLVCKGSFARLALKWFYLQMNAVHMRMKLIRHGKFLITL